MELMRMELSKHGRRSFCRVAHAWRPCSDNSLLDMRILSGVKFCSHYVLDKP